MLFRDYDSSSRGCNSAAGQIPNGLERSSKSERQHKVAFVDRLATRIAGFGLTMHSRLNVLRGILSEVTVLEKRSEGIQTLKQLHTLLSKRRNACEKAATEFQGAGRDDLVGKENEQIGVLQAYMEECPGLSTDTITAEIKDLLRWMQSKGSHPKSDKKAMKYLYEKGGPFHGEIVDDAFVKETWKRLIRDLPPWDPSLRLKERHDRYDNWNKHNDRPLLAG